jgi:hypothetical protein
MLIATTPDGDANAAEHLPHRPIRFVFRSSINIGRYSHESPLQLTATADSHERRIPA